jgi:hypothetical protein
MNLVLTVDEINIIMHALGELPAKTNAFALAMKIKEQAEPQLPKEAVPDQPAPQG